MIGMNDFFINEKGQAQPTSSVQLTEKDFECKDSVGIF